MRQALRRGHLLPVNEDAKNDNKPRNIWKNGPHVRTYPCYPCRLVGQRWWRQVVIKLGCCQLGYVSPQGVPRLF